MNKKIISISIQSILCIVFSVCFLTGCSREPQKAAEQAKSPESGETRHNGGKAGRTFSASNEVASESKLLATVSNLAYTDALSQSQSIPPKIVFSDGGHGVAYLAGKTGAYRVVFNGKPGRLYSLINHLKLSPDGSHVAHDMLAGGKRRMVLDGKEGKTYDDVWEPIYSPDSRHIAYIAQVGKKSYIVVDDNVISEGYDSFNDNPVFSADSKRVAYIVSGSQGMARLFVSDLTLQKKSSIEIREEIVLNKQKTRIAAVQIVNSKQRVIQFSFDQPDIIKEGALFDSINKPAFGGDGISVAYLAKRHGANYLVLNSREGRLPEGEPQEAPVVRPDNKGAGVLMATKDGWFFYETFVGTGAKRKKYQEAAQIVYSNDGSQYAYCAREGKKLFVVANGNEGPAFDMVISPMFSPDGSRLVYRARKDGKRFVVVADSKGKVIRQHPRYELVYDTLFTADGASIAYGVKDGDSLIWKVEKL